MMETLPKSYQQIEDVIDILKRIHLETGNLATKAAAASGETRRGLLSNSLAKRQEEMADALEKSSQHADSKVRTTWIQFLPFEVIESQLEEIQAAESFPEDFPEQLMRLQNQIADLVETAREESMSVEVDEFLASLIDQERGEAKFSAESLLGMDDV